MANKSIHWYLAEWDFPVGEGRYEYGTGEGEEELSVLN